MPLPDFVVGVGGVVATGLATVAYSTPKIYMRMLPYLVVTLAASVLGGMVWVLGKSEAWRSLRDFIPAEKRVDAEAALSVSSNTSDVFVVLIACIVVLSALLGLAHIVDAHNREEEQKKREAEKV